LLPDPLPNVYPHRSICLNGNGSHQDYFPFLAGLEIPPAWEAAAARFVQEGGPVMVLGAPDTGKSTLCRYLVFKAYLKGHQAALVDLDLGQSHLGPPATLGLGLFPPRHPGDDGLQPEGLYFIGRTSPVGSILEVVVGCRVLVDLALSRGYTRVVANTSGLVQGPGALRLKRAQAELLHPTLLLALPRDRELDPLLQGLGEKAQQTWSDSSLIPLPLAGGGEDGVETGDLFIPTLTLPHQEEGKGGILDWPIIRLPVSSRTRRKTPEERRAYREKRFRRYFQEARSLALPWRGLAWEGLPWGHGEPLSAQALEQFRPGLGVRPLYGESQGRRAVLLLAEPPAGRLPENSRQGWERVHWLTWPSHHQRLVGLLDGQRRTLSLGLIIPGPWDPETLALWSPLAPELLPRVRFVKVGQLRLNRRGQELSQG
jgi:polynucleotide 5'-hydroxyl-kinase GRC3/NOL9